MLVVACNGFVDLFLDDIRLRRKKIIKPEAGLLSHYSANRIIEGCQLPLKMG